MKMVVFEKHGIKLLMSDFTDCIEDYTSLTKIDPLGDRPDFIPVIKESFFKSQGYSLPAVKVDHNKYLLITLACKLGKNSWILDYAYALVDLDILVMTQHYYYHRAKLKYERNPETTLKYKTYQDEDGYYHRRYVEINKPFRKRGRNTMTQIQFILSKFIHSNYNVWKKHRELQEEIKYKQIDYNFQLLESESSYAKGRETSFGQGGVNRSLLKRRGVLTKLQNGDTIGIIELMKIDSSLKLFFDKFCDLKNQLREHSVTISYAKGTYLHASKNLGIWHPYYRTIAVSSFENFNSTLAHELGHFIDFYLGRKEGRHYLSQDQTSIAGQIASVFRGNMRKRQTSDYLNSTIECFARAIQQYYCTITKQPHLIEKSCFCDPDAFQLVLIPLITNLIDKLKQENRQKQLAMHLLLNSLLTSQKAS